MNKRSRFRFELILAIVLIGLAVIVWKKDFRSNQEIDNNKGETVGKITDYQIVGPDNHYLNYSYIVEGAIYHNRIVSKKTFKNCEKTKDCIGRKFKVYYSKIHPNKSRIELSHEIK
jgi:thioredoxin-related protein